jgi:hypothetical protein
MAFGDTISLSSCAHDAQTSNRQKRTDLFKKRELRVGRLAAEGGGIENIFDARTRMTPNEKFNLPIPPNVLSHLTTYSFRRGIFVDSRRTDGEHLVSNGGVNSIEGHSP